MRALKRRFEARRPYTRTQVRYLFSRLVGLPHRVQKLHWIFLATLPNSGSTAFARVIESSPSVALIENRGEGQWLLPDLCANGHRWDPEHKINYTRVRHIWSLSALNRNPSATLVFDKSPPSLVRLDQLRATFGGTAATSVISFSRDPLAICASWVKRYTPEATAKNWIGSASPDMPRGRDYYRLLGSLCGKRMQLLAHAREMATLHVSYEEFCVDPEGFSSRLLQEFPTLSHVNTSRPISVKDYSPQTLVNMNEQQRRSLSSAQSQAILEGLAPYKDAIARLGYTAYQCKN